MSKKFNETDINHCTYYFFDEMINIIIESYKNILIYYIGYVMVANFRYVRSNGANYLCSIIVKINGFFQETNETEYMMLVSPDENKDTLKKYEEHGTKLKILLDQ